jgi:hypothetical protein
VARSAVNMSRAEEWPRVFRPCRRSGNMCLVESPYKYAMEKAPPDVQGALRCLSDAEFAVRIERGGPTESFGNVLLEWERPPTVVRVVRDRGQWLIDIAADGVEFDWLQVIMNAMDGGEFIVPDRELGDPLPETLPEGVAWSTAVPTALSWLTENNRSTELVAARERRRVVMKAYWDRHKPRRKPE